MIIIQLKGGLGNQLFQYAAGLSLALHHDVPVKVDIMELLGPDEEIGTLRNYELKHLSQPPLLATTEEINDVKQKPLWLFYLQKVLPPYKRKNYKEASFRFDPHFFKAKKNIYLKGYRQSEKYFKPIEKMVRKQLFLSAETYKNVVEFGKQLKHKPSVSIHIRRGDYTNKALTEWHGVLDQSYYQKAIEIILNSVDHPEFYIFSDNPEWVKQNLTFNQDVHFVSGSISQTHYEDLYLMSCCRHNIIANSSFSWWAAWFNDNPNKKVIAPLKWFDKAGYDTSDLIPEGWTRI